MTESAQNETSANNRSSFIGRSAKIHRHTLLTVAEVADLLRLTPKGVYSLIENRRIPFIKVSNRVRFFESDVISWLRKNRVPALEENQ